MRREAMSLREGERRRTIYRAQRSQDTTNAVVLSLRCFSPGRFSP